MTVEEAIVVVLAFIGVGVTLIILAHATRPSVRCTTCNEAIKGVVKGECDFCQRERHARAAASFSYSSGQLMEQILLTDTEMRRMYDHNKERFGEGASITAYLTAALLYITGLAGALAGVDRNDILFMAGGLAIAVVLKVWRAYGESKKSQRV